MKKEIRSLVTALEDGVLKVQVRTARWEWGHLGYGYYYYPNEDRTLFKTKVSIPKLTWNKELFLDYKKKYPGRLTYREFCENVNKDNIYVFNDFTKCSDALFEAASRTIKA